MTARPSARPAAPFAPAPAQPLRLRSESASLARRLVRRLRPLDAALLALAGGLWLAPGWLPALGFPLLVLVGWRRWRRLGATAGTPLDRPVSVLVGLGVAALLPSVDLTVSLPRLLGLWLGVALFLTVFDLLTSEKRLWLVVSALAVLGMALALVGLVGTVWSPTGRPALQAVYQHLPRLITFLPRSDAGGLNPHKLAAALAMLLPLPVAVMLFTPGRLLRLGWGLGAALMAVTLLLTQSGSGLCAAGVALLALGATRWRRVRLALPIFAAIALGLGWWIGPRTVADALLALPLVPGARGTAADRLAVWARAVALIQERPWLGIGIGTFPIVVERYGPPLAADGLAAAVTLPHAHNLYLQFALDLGLPGLAAFLAVVAGVFRLAWSGVRLGPTARARGLVAGVAGGLLAYLTYGLFDAIGPGEKPGLFLWLLLAIVAAGARLARRPQLVPLAVELRSAAAADVAGRRGINGLLQTPPIGSVIYVSTFEWDYHTARPQQLARALAERFPVLYVETTGLRGVGAGDLPRLLRRIRRGLAGRHQPRPGIWVFSPLVLPLHHSRLARALNRLLLRDAIRGQAGDLGLVNPLLLISIPTAASIDLVGHLGEAATIYDCMDDLTAIPTVDGSVGVAEAELARSVDVVVAASDELRRAKAGLRADIAVVGQGVDAAHFQAPAGCPPDLARLPRPRLLCVGGIDERIDFALLDDVARLRPEWSIVLVGPELYVRAAERIRLPNVHLLGRRSYDELPGYVQNADVCLIPYRDTPWARACNPVKTLEYLAAGRPVVSTDLPAVRLYQPLVRIARGAPAFVMAIQAALEEDSAAWREVRCAAAGGKSWPERADAIYRLAVAPAARRRRTGPATLAGALPAGRRTVPPEVALPCDDQRSC